MNVTTLQQFLRSLINPLKASETPQRTVEDLERMMVGLDPFATKSVGEFATFLIRAHGYEQEGHWPQSAPSIQGNVVDAPPPQEYAERLRAFLLREVPASGPMSESVPKELESLKVAMKLPQLKELATACGVTGVLPSASKVIERTFEQITGRKLPDALVDMYNGVLVRSRDNHEVLVDALDRMQAALSVAQIKKVAKQLGVQATIKSKQDGADRIRDHLAAPGSDEPIAGEPPHSDPGPSPLSAEHINRLVEAIRTLKSKADPENAPYDEIEEELKIIESNINHDEAAAIANQLGAERGIRNKADAMNRIRGEVFESKRIREKIRY